MNHLHVNSSKKPALLKRLEPKFTSKIGFSTQEGVYIVHWKDILYLHAIGNYTQVHLMDGAKIMVSRTLGHIENQLPDSNFKRCHKSFVINLNEVVAFRDSIFLSNELEIPVSRRKRKEIKDWFVNKVTFI